MARIIVLLRVLHHAAVPVLHLQQVVLCYHKLVAGLSVFSLYSSQRVVLMRLVDVLPLIIMMLSYIDSHCLQSFLIVIFLPIPILPPITATNSLFIEIFIEYISHCILLLNLFFEVSPEISPAEHSAINYHQD